MSNFDRNYDLKIGKHKALLYRDLLYNFILIKIGLNPFTVVGTGPMPTTWYYANTISYITNAPWACDKIANSAEAKMLEEKLLLAFRK